jgi:NADH:ubiquinone oxidoreductase subunit F (NADH-binding)
MGLLDLRGNLGPLPVTAHGFIDVLERSELAGRGGAGFPTATKWRAVAKRARGDAVILVNGAECEPQSKKDRSVMTALPDLVLDGAFIAARVLRARRIVLYIGERHTAARDAMARALDRRAEPERRLVSFASAPHRYVAGVENAAVHLVNEGVATPTTVPPYPFERGVDGAPTLVQNVETLAHVAALARTGRLPGTLLLTLAGAVEQPGVLEVPAGTTVGDAIAAAGGPSSVPRAILVGGYFGRWMKREDAWQLPLTPSAGIGCGVIGVLAETRCPVCDVAGIMRYLAGESSAQCGPCFFGLRALADACTRIAERGANANDLKRLHRWAAEVRGRGACKHPDGAAIFLSSALSVFAPEFAGHTPHRLVRSA